MGEPTWWYGPVGRHSSSSSRWLQAQMVPPLRSRRRSPRCGRGAMRTETITVKSPSIWLRESVGARRATCWRYAGQTGKQLLNAGSP